MSDFEFQLNDMVQDGDIHFINKDALLKAHQAEIATARADAIQACKKAVKDALGKPKDLKNTDYGSKSYGCGVALAAIKGVRK